MPTVRRMLGAGLHAILGVLLCSAAVAADLEQVDYSWIEDNAPGASRPAVDGLNLKVSAFGGGVDDIGFYGGAGSVSVPLGHRFGLQVDGVAAGFDTDFAGNVTLAGTAAHLFWRDPSIGLLGLYGQYLNADVLGGVDVVAGGVEGALYLGRFTLEGVAGAMGGEIDTGAFGSFDIETRFFDVAQFSYYPTDNLKLSVGHSYGLGTHAALFGAEWGFDVGGGSMVALFARGSVFENGDGAAMGGVSLYVGQRNKTLIRRHREDDPLAVGPVGPSPSPLLFAILARARDLCAETICGP